MTQVNLFPDWQAQLELAEIRAELAEAEVERLRQSWSLIYGLWREERALADQLAASAQGRFPSKPLVLVAWETRRLSGDDSQPSDGGANRGGRPSRKAWTPSL